MFGLVLEKRSFSIGLAAPFVLLMMGNTSEDSREQDESAFCLGGGAGAIMAVSNIAPKSVLTEGGALPEDFETVRFGGDDAEMLDLKKDKTIAFLTESQAVPVLSANGIATENMGCFVAPTRAAAVNFIGKVRASSTGKTWIEIRIGKI